MGKHKEWRKIAKKERRRRIRIRAAKSNDFLMDENSEEYKLFLEEQHDMEYNFELEQIVVCNRIENEKWLQAEAIAIKQWNIRQEKKKQLIQEYLEQEAKLKLEWELEEKRKKEELEKLERIKEEKKQKHESFILQLEQFLSGDCSAPPHELILSHESRPTIEVCPFFTKTACCRFGDQCSRNHKYPGISNVLLATNLFVHFGLDNSNFTEYDTDVMLEYEDTDTYREFVDFFNDVLPEFEKFGRITQFKVCHNYEKHLRGNTYIEFEELRCAVAAYKSLHSRWYGGKQISLQFCAIDSWNSAICGLASTKRCPKGRWCNYLHVFRNPNHRFEDYYRLEHKRLYYKSPSRNWRWSESPEREEIRSRRTRSPERHSTRDRYSEYHRKSSSSGRRRRSRSSERSIHRD